jgi:glyceraldehyde-3-phosphate dehydrogenase/erythrose-4-phosphate dehydrogenase
VHGKWRQCHESADGESFTVDGKKVSITQKQTIGEVDWKGLGCQMVLGECLMACTNLRQIPCLSY